MYLLALESIWRYLKNRHVYCVCTLIPCSFTIVRSMSQYDRGHIEVLIFSIEFLNVFKRKKRFVNEIESIHTVYYHLNKSKTIKIIFDKRHKSFKISWNYRGRVPYSQNKNFSLVCFSVQESFMQLCKILHNFWNRWKCDFLCSRAWIQCCLYFSLEFPIL